MNIHLARSLSTIALAALLGCSSSTSPAESPSAPKPSLAGHYVSDTCEASAGANGQVSYLKRDFTLTDASWSLALTIYGDAACGARLLVVDIAGSYKIGGASSQVSSANEAEFLFGSRAVTPLAQPLADALNSAGCGDGSFSVGRSEDTLVAGCALLGAYPVAKCDRDNDIVRLDGDRLFFGERPADNDMCTPDHRPVKLTRAAVVRTP